MKWFEWKSFASRSIDKFCSLQDLLRLRGGVTDAWSRSANFNCAASMRPRRFLGCGSLRLPLCNSGKPDEMTVRPETRGRDGDREEAAKRPPLRNERARPSAHSGSRCAAQADWHICARDALQNLLVDRISRFGASASERYRRSEGGA